MDRRFGSYSASELIDAASFLIEALRKNGNYTAYMDSTIGSLRVQNKKLANALALFEKWLYMDSLDNISEANKIYYEIKAIADELSKDYADNQVTQMLSMGIVRKL